VTAPEQPDEPVRRPAVGEQIRRAVEHHTVVGIAVDVIMDRLHVDRDAALAYLSRVSSTQNRDLEVVASELAESGRLPVSGRGSTGVR
jgi:hypothetical protein